ncbi:hypothetical protein QFZ79_004394 [Arthrobacter sp. V4I6]|uniref:SHOCT domain-containing protein n=1 Tax=unclassified Arthrobacter TaxID=235627 RepID=UPI0027857234|nr:MULTISPECIES: SHOCT domain-containing protein [unclassified Arthrobacter]MDQ0822014.1 hypothetical protein [Arthrobacter sp. V1I7]MDQ0856283.1 hypothetical protein [Arthrobacter sp. V4I6]
MNNLFFWLIVLSFLVPMALRLYRKSVRGRNQNQGKPGGFLGKFGQFPGDSSGSYPGQQNNQPRDGFTQRDYFGGFGQLGAPQQPIPPANQPYPGEQFPGQPYPGQPGQPYPGQPGYPPQGYQSPVPYEDSPEYPGNRPQPSQQPDRQQPAQPQSGPRPSGPSVPPPPSAPQGFRARKLAELDQRYSDGELTMEDYMAQRAEIMKG